MAKIVGRLRDGQGMDNFLFAMILIVCSFNQSLNFNYNHHLSSYINVMYIPVILHLLRNSRSASEIYVLSMILVFTDWRKQELLLESQDPHISLLATPLVGAMQSDYPHITNVVAIVRALKQANTLPTSHLLRDNMHKA